MAPLAVAAIGYVQLSAVMDYDSGKIVVTGQTMSPNMALTVNGIDLTSDAAGAFQTAFVPQGVSSGDAVTVTATVMAYGEEKSCSCQVTYLSPQGVSGVIAQIKTASANELTPLLAQLGIDISSDPFYALLADKAAFAAMLQSQSFAHGG